MTGYNLTFKNKYLVKRSTYAFNIMTGFWCTPGTNYLQTFLRSGTQWVMWRGEEIITRYHDQQENAIISRLLSHATYTLHNPHSRLLMEAS